MGRSGPPSRGGGGGRKGFMCIPNRAGKNFCRRKAQGQEAGQERKGDGKKKGKAIKVHGMERKEKERADYLAAREGKKADLNHCSNKGRKNRKKNGKKKHKKEKRKKGRSPGLTLISNQVEEVSFFYVIVSRGWDLST